MFQCLPRWCTHAMFAVLFPVAYFGIRQLVGICRKNLYRVYGGSKTPKDYNAMTRSCFKEMGHAMLDMLYFVRRPKALKDITRIHGEDHLRDALDKQRGAVVVTAHLGNFPLMFLSLVSLGYKVNVVIRSMRDKEFSRFMYDLCALWGIRMLETLPQRTFLKEALTALHRNELLVILLDEVVPPQEGVQVSFLGTEVTRGTGPMLFHQRTGSDIIPMFIAQDVEKHFQIFIEPALKIEGGSDTQEIMRKHIAQLTQIMESYIRQYPTQWGGWLNKRWMSQGA